MRRCLDNGDVSALHDAVSLWVPDSVRFALLAKAAHLPFPGRDVELSGVFYAHEGFGSDDAKVRDVGFLAVKYLEWRLHLERLLRSLVLEVHHQHEQLPPHRRWKTAISEHAPSHGAQSSPHAFRHTGLLRYVGGGELLDNTGLQAVLTKLLPSPPLSARQRTMPPPKRNDRRADEQLKLLESLVFSGQQVDGGPFGALVSYLADVPVAAYSHWREALIRSP